MAKEVKIKNDIAQKVLNNRLLVVKMPKEKDRANLQYDAYKKESKKLLEFCKKMMGKREQKADTLKLEQPEGVLKVKEISKEKLDEKFKEIIDQPQYVKPIGENTLPPFYSREISRYEPPNPIKQKEREDLLEKVREMTSEESKGGKGEKLVEVDTDLSWDHEGLKPLPKPQKDESPKPPRIPKDPRVTGNDVETPMGDSSSIRRDHDKGKYPDSDLKKDEVIPHEEKSVPKTDRKSNKSDEFWDYKGPEGPTDNKTARWIKEQNEFLGKSKELGFQEMGKERDPPMFKPKGPIKILQRQRANPHTGYE